MESIAPKKRSVSRKQALLKLQLAAVEKWLSYPAHSGSHPVIGYAADRYFRAQGLNLERVHFSAHAILEGLGSEPIFEHPDIQWGSVKDRKIEHVVKAVEHCEPKVPVRLNSGLAVTVIHPRQPNLIQQRFIEIMNEKGTADLTSWLWNLQHQFVEHLQTCVLELSLDSAEERWAGMFLSDPKAFAIEIAEKLA